MQVNLSSSLILALALHAIQGQKYEDVHDIHKDLFNKSRYHNRVVPKLNQSEPLYVTVSFGLISIVSVDDVIQSFTCNGVMHFSWIDERLIWNFSDYGGQKQIHPSPEVIWRPRVLIMNNLGGRDPLEGEDSLVVVSYTGHVNWVHADLFAVACSLSLLKYPFDEQQCVIEMLPLGLTEDSLTFVKGHPRVISYFINGEWQLVHTAITNHDGSRIDAPLSYIQVTFKVKRRPTMYVFNYILPVVFLSLLNMVVFFIPAESGEKISYGITVVLAISVFLSQVSEMLPRASEQVPYVTIYLFSLYLVSVLTALDAIFIVFLHHLEEKALYRQRLVNRLRHAVQTMNNVRRVSVSPMEKDTTFGQDEDCQKGLSADGKGDNVTAPSRYELIGDRINAYSFVLFILIWIAINIWFFISVGT